MSQPKQQQKRKINNEYILSKILGSGQYGTVHLAYQIGKNENVKLAIKQIPKSKLNDYEIERILEEKHNLLEITHPNVIQLVDVILTKNNYYFVSGYCKGGDLRSFMKRNANSLTEAQIQPLAAQLLCGLLHLRQFRIVHRDIKPENILIDYIEKQKIIKIADLGLSRKLQDYQLAKTMCGTPLYSSPEILRQQEYDFKADLWSFGVIVYEMLLGNLPYSASSIPNLKRKFHD